MLVLENRELMRQWEQYVQRLRGWNKAGGLQNEDEDGVVGA